MILFINWELDLDDNVEKRYSSWSMQLVKSDLEKNSEKERMGNFLETNEPWRHSSPRSTDFATQDQTGRTSI